MAVIGLDLGGTKLSGACFSSAGQPVERSTATLAGLSGSDVGALVIAQMRELVARSAERVDGVGVAIPGIYRAATGTVWAPNIPGWDDYPLVQSLRDALPSDMPVRVDSDRACAILGEAWCGRAQPLRMCSLLPTTNLRCEPC